MSQDRDHNPRTTNDGTSNEEATIEEPDPMIQEAEEELEASQTAELDSDLMSRLRGKRIGERYEIYERIGKGGAGLIFKGEHVGLERSVVIKFLRPSKLQDQSVSPLVLGDVSPLECRSLR